MNSLYGGMGEWGQGLGGYAGSAGQQFGNLAGYGSQFGNLANQFGNLMGGYNAQAAQDLTGARNQFANVANTAAGYQDFMNRMYGAAGQAHAAAGEAL